jgi:hypothetical protein
MKKGVLVETCLFEGVCLGHVFIGHRVYAPESALLVKVYTVFILDRPK